MGKPSRKHLGVNYPALYSDKHPEFNCHQRVHQNTLEHVPFYLLTLLAAGIRFPLLASGCGGLWTAGRVLYTLQYGGKGPRYRVPGAVVTGVLGELPLLVLTVLVGLEMVGMIAL